MYIKIKRSILINVSSTIFLMFTILSLTVIDTHAQTSPVIIKGIEYRFDNGKWYNYVGNRRADEIIPQRLVVRLADKGLVENFDFQKLGIQGVSLASPRYLDGFYVLSLPPKADPFDIAKRLESTGLFENIHFDALGRAFATPDDPLFSEQWNLTKIEMPDTWNITTGDSEKILAFIDLGFEWDHEDLAENLWQNLGEDINQNGKTVIFSNGEWIFDPGDVNGQDDDGNGKADDFVGWDFVNNNNDTKGDIHGTEVCGIAVAKTFNAKGLAGVAGGWQNQKGVGAMMLQVSIGQSVAESAISQAIDYAVEKGAKVINMSIGVQQPYDDVEVAVNTAAAAGVIMVAAAGNNGGTTSPNKQIFEYPALYPETITVGATDEGDYRWDAGDRNGSAIGEELDLMAPGSSLDVLTNNGYSTGADGTSGAAPHVAGLAALILSINNSLSPATVENIMKSTAVWQTWFNANEYGEGRINAYEALKYTLENYGGTLEQSFTIPDGETFNIQPGVTLKFAPGTNLTVKGTLNVNGTSSNPVTFTSSGSSWNGLYFSQGSGTLKYCNLDKLTGGWASGAITISNSSPLFENCTIDVLSGGYVFGVSTSGSSSQYVPKFYRCTVQSASGPAMRSSGGYLYLHDTEVIQTSSEPAVRASGGAEIECWLPATHFDGKNKIEGGKLFADGNSLINAGDGSADLNHFCDGSAATLEVSSGGTIYAQGDYWPNDNDPTKINNGGSIYFSNNLGASDCSGIGLIAAKDEDAASTTFTTQSSLSNASTELFEAKAKVRNGLFSQAGNLFIQIVQSQQMPEAHTALLELSRLYARAQLPAIKSFISDLSKQPGRLQATAMKMLADIHAFDGENSQALQVLFDTMANNENAHTHMQNTTLREWVPAKTMRERLLIDVIPA